MSSRAALAVSLLCAIASIAEAERRPVAVIDLTLSDDTSDVVRQLNVELGTHPVLSRLASVNYENALVSTPPDDEEDLVLSAQTNLKLAEGYLAKYNSNSAFAATDTGLSGLYDVTPQNAAPLFGQLALVAGQAELGQRHLTEAHYWFTLARALIPDLALDPDQYFSEVIEAFANAKVEPSKKDAKLDIRGLGEIWIDGQSYGSAPRLVEIAAGRHVIQLTGIERKTQGTKADAIARPDPTVVTIPTVYAPYDVQIRRARLALAHANDAVARASAMGRLAKLIGVGDAILLGMRDGKVTIQTWRDRAPGFSSTDERGARTAAELLEALAPPPEKVVPPPPEIIIPDPPRWWESRELQVGTGVTVAAIIVISILWASSGLDTFAVTTDIKISTPTQTR